MSFYDKLKIIMIIQALQRLGPANDHSGTAGECWPLLLSTFSQYSEKAFPMVFFLLKAPIIAFTLKIRLYEDYLKWAFEHVEST